MLRLGMTSRQIELKGPVKCGGFCRFDRELLRLKIDIEGRSRLLGIA